MYNINVIINYIKFILIWSYDIISVIYDISIITIKYKYINIIFNLLY